MLPNPLQIDAQRFGKLRQWPRKSTVERHELETSELFGDVVNGNRLEDNRQEPRCQFSRTVHLPGALLGFDRFRRDDKYDRIRLRNEAAEARFPVLASSDVVAVEEWREATIFETRHQFVGKRGRI